MGFSKQEYWIGLPFPSPGDFPNPGIEHRSSALQTDTLPSEPPGKPLANTRPSYKFMSLVAGKYKLLVQLPNCPCEKNFPIPPRAFPLGLPWIRLPRPQSFLKHISFWLKLIFSLSLELLLHPRMLFPTLLPKLSSPWLNSADFPIWPFEAYYIPPPWPVCDKSFCYLWVIILSFSVFCWMVVHYPTLRPKSFLYIC